MSLSGEINVDSLDAFLWIPGNPIDRGIILDLLKEIARTNPAMLPFRLCEGKRLVKPSDLKGLSSEDAARTVMSALEKRMDLAEVGDVCIEGGDHDRKMFLSLCKSQSPRDQLSLLTLTFQSRGRIRESDSSWMTALFSFMTEKLSPSYANLASGKERLKKEYAPQKDRMGRVVAVARPGLRPEDGLFAMYHLNYFGALYVDFFGRNKFDEVGRTKAKVIDLKTGDVIVKVGEAPEDWEQESNITLSMELARILDHNAFMDRNDSEKKLQSPFVSSDARPDRESEDASASGLTRVTDPMREQIAGQSRLFIKGMKQAFDVKMKLDVDSLAALDDLIDGGWAGKVPDSLDQVVESFGSFFGEALMAVYGGEWRYDSELEEYAVSITESLAVYPFSKMRKRFTHGRADSIAKLLRVIDKELGRPRSGQDP